MKSGALVILTLILPLLADCQWGWTGYESIINPGSSILDCMKAREKIISLKVCIYEPNCGPDGCKTDEEQKWSSHKLKDIYREYSWVFNEKGQPVRTSECKACGIPTAGNEYHVEYYEYNAQGLEVRKSSKDSIPPLGIRKSSETIKEYDAQGRLILVTYNTNGLFISRDRTQYPDAYTRQTFRTSPGLPEHLSTESTLDKNGRETLLKSYEDPEAVKSFSEESWFHPFKCTWTEYYEDGRMKKISTNFCGDDALQESHSFSYDDAGRLIQVGGESSRTFTYAAGNPWPESEKKEDGAERIGRYIWEYDEQENPRVWYITFHYLTGFTTSFPLLFRKFVFEIKYRE